MLIDVDYSYYIREWGNATFDVDDKEDLDNIEGIVLDHIKDTFDHDVTVSDVEIETIKETKRNG